MLRVINDGRITDLSRARAAGDALWLDRADVEPATGWQWKAEGLCRDDTCIPIPRQPGRHLQAGEHLDIAGMWRYVGWPLARSQAGDIWVLGEGATRRSAALASLSAPDFTLPDLSGRLHRLSDFRGNRVFLVTWASWCGCRAELSNWNALYGELKEHGFLLLAVALDEPDAARTWIQAASPTYPCLIDRDHVTAELYNLVNVPQAVWIDEAGRLVRPPESAGMTDAFRAMDRESLVLPAQARAARDRAKSAYFDAVRDWALRGPASPHVLGAEALLKRLKLPHIAVAEAHAHFRLGQALLRAGRKEESAAEFAEASRLHPDSWAIWRQAAEKSPNGLAVGEAFWRRLDALEDRYYYEPSELT